MKPADRNPAPDGDADPAPKPYEPPELTVLGTVAELTRGGTNVGFDGVAGGGGGGGGGSPLSPSQ